jgi:hypothetical protein
MSVIDLVGYDGAVLDPLNGFVNHEQRIEKPLAWNGSRWSRGTASNRRMGEFRGVA